MSLIKRIKAIFPFTFKADTKKVMVKSQTGFLMLNENGVASVDYSNPEARKKLREQIEFFANVKVAKS